jgi:zinc protease
MISFERKILGNGLTVLVHEDGSTPMAVVNLLYDVGSSDEDPQKTGSAHLLEHLMFGGSANITSFDREVHRAGGENNAYTTNDITNYHIHLPAVNLETGFWVESDRMLDLSFSQKGFDIQKNVVIEEFRQRYINQPYGDLWKLIRSLAYTVHPYRWPVIGMDLLHIANQTLEEIRQFYHEHYCPSNAIMCIAGNVKAANCFALAEKWFGDLRPRKRTRRDLPGEPEQQHLRKLKVFRDVPAHEIVLAYGMCERKSPQYYTVDLISDLLTGGRSSGFYRQLVMEKKLFSQINAYLTGSRDPGLFIIKGRPAADIGIEEAHEAILGEIRNFTLCPPLPGELNKARNKTEAMRQYSYSSILNKAADLAYHELFGDAGNINAETDNYRKISNTDVHKVSHSLFDPGNCSVLYYCSNPEP